MRMFRSVPPLVYQSFGCVHANTPAKPQNRHGKFLEISVLENHAASPHTSDSSIQQAVLLYHSQNDLYT
jgi:hypothetical protein